jgi:hypothetical protein
MLSGTAAGPAASVPSFAAAGVLTWLNFHGASGAAALNVRYGQKRTFRSAIAMSALLPKADIREHEGNSVKAETGNQCPGAALGYLAGPNTSGFPKSVKPSKTINTIKSSQRGRGHLDFV